jgi:FAD/FMN-containing dehydrogenase
MLEGIIEMSVTLQSLTPNRIVTTAGANLAVLREQLTGRLISAASPDYDEVRASFFLGVEARRPLAIVRPENAQDVAAAVNFARERGLPFAVRSGGHGLGHHNMIDDGIVVDFASMKRVTIDPVAGTARVQAGATSGDLAGPAAEHELALSTGDTASVGMGGLVTGGGIGFMARKYGLAIDNLLKAQVVLANGEIVTASETEHAELFWAIRGGGGNFGVVTEFTFRMAPVGQILGGVIAIPATHETIRGYLDYAAAAPDDLNTIANIMHLPPAPFVPAERIGELSLVILVTWSGSIEAGQQALAPIRALAAPSVDMVQPMPYPGMYKLTEHQTASHGASIRSMFADDLSDGAIDAMLTAVQQSPTPFSVVHLRGMGGAVARVSPDATAFAHRSQRYFVTIIGLWLDPADDGATTKTWVNDLWQTIRPEGSGVYVNFMEVEGPERIKDAYPAATLARLAEIKAVYDPQNLFRANQNIAPKA